MLDQSSQTVTCKAAVPCPLAHAAREPGVPGSLLQCFKFLWLHVVWPITVYLDEFNSHKKEWTKQCFLFYHVIVLLDGGGGDGGDGDHQHGDQQHADQRGYMVHHHNLCNIISMKETFLGDFFIFLVELNGISKLKSYSHFQYLFKMFISIICIHALLA